MSEPSAENVDKAKGSSRRDPFSLLRSILGPGRWWKTLLVLLAVGIMVRLGFWQLDRLKQRRLRNAQIVAQMTRPPLLVNSMPSTIKPAHLRYHRLEARGVFDFEHEFALKNQSWKGQAGYHLITPLRLEGQKRAVLVDRGWIPYAEGGRTVRRKFDQPTGLVVVHGFLGEQALPPRHASGPFLPESNTATLYYVDPPSLQKVLPYPLMPFYVEWTAKASTPETSLPYRPVHVLDLSEGPHLGYAVQWFSFALIFLVGYLYWISRHQGG